MNLVLPPIFFYGIGVLLVVLGGLRAYHLGWKSKPRHASRTPLRPLSVRRSDGEPASGAALEAGETTGEEVEEELEDDDERDEDELAAERASDKSANRHIKFGLLWVGLGLFLLLSTIVKSRH